MIFRHGGAKKHEGFAAEKRGKGGYAEMIFFVLVRGFGSGFWFVVLVRGFGSCPHEPIMIFLLTHG